MCGTQLWETPPPFTGSSMGCFCFWDCDCGLDMGVARVRPFGPWVQRGGQRARMQTTTWQGMTRRVDQTSRVFGPKTRNEGRGTTERHYPTWMWNRVDHVTIRLATADSGTVKCQDALPHGYILQLARGSLCLWNSFMDLAAKDGMFTTLWQKQVHLRLGVSVLYVPYLLSPEYITSNLNPKETDN